jgi:Cd2+/Zn2+-exporting ATPase
MIGRYKDVSKYRELLQMKEFYTVLLGFISVITSYFLGKTTHVWFSDMLALLAVTVLGGPIILGAVKGLVRKELNVDELVSLAIIAAVLIGQYLTAAEIALIMVLGSLVEEFTAQKARSAINSLIRLSPQQAIITRENKEVSVPVEEIQLGDMVIIRSGEKIPVDGTVVRGNASLNQASLTGESLPVEKETGDIAYAGTVCYSGMIVVEAQKVGAETTLGKLIKLVQNAENQKAPILRSSDRYAKYFTPVIITISILVFLFTRDLHRAITVLIVGCPCSFILSAPTAIVSALGNASRNGILVKGGALLEEMSKIDAVVFDKTGTLTTGRPIVTEFKPLNCVNKDYVLSAAAAAEKYSEHPLARAILEAAEKRELSIAEPEKFKNVPGRGVEAWVDGKYIFVGTSTPKETPIENNSGVKTVIVKENNTEIGEISIIDEIRVEVPGLVKLLKDFGINKIQMLTGDDFAVAAHVAQLSGIKEFYAELFPDDKLAHIQRLQKSGYKVAVIGDGINDAPSLARANVGIAMGALGTDVALEASDIALMKDDLSKLPYLLRLAGSTVKTINVNITFALVFNVLALILSGLGLLNPIMGAVSHNVGSVLVVLNSARLIKPLNQKASNFNTMPQEAPTSPPAHHSFDVSLAHQADK